MLFARKSDYPIAFCCNFFSYMNCFCIINTLDVCLNVKAEFSYILFSFSFGSLIHKMSFFSVDYESVMITTHMLTYVVA